PITSVAVDAAAAASVVTSTPGGRSTSDRYQGFLRTVRTASTTSALRAQSRTPAPPRARWTASAVPQLPAPSTVIIVAISDGSSRGRLLPQPRLGARPQTADVGVVAAHDDQRGRQRGQDVGDRIAEEGGAQRHAQRAEQGAERDVARGGHDGDEDRQRGQRRPRHQSQERAEAGGPALAATEAEEDGPAVADDRGHRRRRDRPGIRPRQV